MVYCMGVRERINKQFSEVFAYGIVTILPQQEDNSAPARVSR